MGGKWKVKSEKERGRRDMEWRGGGRAGTQIWRGRHAGAGVWQRKVQDVKNQGSGEMEDQATFFMAVGERREKTQISSVVFLSRAEYMLLSSNFVPF